MPIEPDRGAGIIEPLHSTRTLNPDGPADKLLDAALAQQRREWVAGKRTPVAELLQQYPELASNPAWAAELAYHEFLLRKEWGEALEWEHYLLRFPQYAAALQLLHQADQVVEQALNPSTPVTLLPAAQFGNYEVLEEIGHGGMGVVFKARDRRLCRVVALKMLRTGESAGAEERKRFHREACAVARLQHPNIVQIYEVGEAAGQPFFVLEFVEGQSLAHRLDGTLFPAHRATALIEVLARTMHYAHANGIIHRDLKPSNVLLVETPEAWVAKVTDFGLAKWLDTGGDTQSGAVLGTPSYMAPEQAEGKTAAIDRRTDVYGLGAILYELLAGRPPFRAESPLLTLKQVVEAEPARPRLLNQAVPRDLEIICLKCLEKEPQQRYDSAADLADDLGRCLRGEPVQARCVGPLGRLWRWCRRKPIVAGLIAALVVVLVGGFAGILGQWRKTEMARREAVASDELGQQLLAELIRSGPVAPLHLRYPPSGSNFEPLLKAEAYCEHLLEKRPRDTGIRIALTKVRGSLGTLYAFHGQIAEEAACFQRASDLWEPLVLEDPLNPEYRNWLATTLYWLGQRATAQGELALALRPLLRADAHWQELAEEQPGNMAFLQKLSECRVVLIELTKVERGGEENLSLLKETKAQLVRLVTENPANTVLCKRLALTCFLLGEIYHVKKAATEALPYWRQAHQLYSNLATSRPDDLLVSLSLGVCCSRLMGGQTIDPCYLQAVSLFEQTGKRLTGLLGEYPDSEWVQLALRKNYGCLIVCHWKAGQTRQGENTFEEYKRILDVCAREHPDNPKHDLYLLESLIYVSSALGEAKQLAAALPIAREAATLADRYTYIPSTYLTYRDYLPTCLIPLAALLRQLGDPAESLRQAEHVRRLFEERYRAAPEVSEHGVGLSTAWAYIGKARWELGEADAALAAFREAAAVQRQVFLRAPTTRQTRIQLSRCYDHLIYWGGLRGNRTAVVDALQEQEKLWPENPARLREMSRDYAELAAALAQGKKQLSQEEQAEQQRYRDESSRLERLSRRAKGPSASR